MLKHASLVNPHDFKLNGDVTTSQISIDNSGNTVEVLEGWFTFETSCARCNGHVRLLNGLAITVLTSIVELIGFEELKGRQRIQGVNHCAIKNGHKTWLESRQEELSKLGRHPDFQPYVIIIGGGQAGIALASRLRRLNVSTIIIERNKKPGDSWRQRYKSLCLHDPIWYDHLPYLQFPDDFPVFLPKDKIGDWLEMYVKVMELNYWCSTTAKSANYNSITNQWDVKVEIQHEDCIEEVILHSKQLVFALGVSGYPVVPKIDGSETFLGTQLHSSQFKGSEDIKDKKCVVLGSNNSAHDICTCLWELNADSVTMIQRSSTSVVKSESLMEFAMGSLYSENAIDAGITTDKADMLLASIPYELLPHFQRPIYERIKQVDNDFYCKLQMTGFLLDFGDDESGLFMKYIRRGSGYYIDVGASQLIIDGEVVVKSNVNILEIRPTSVILTDNSELEADIIVYATGYGSMNNFISDIISPEISRKLGKVWGIGSGTTKDPGPLENGGELRNMWKPTNVDSLWVMGGNLHQSRHYSTYLALQLKARMENIMGCMDVYKLTPSTHEY